MPSPLWPPHNNPNDSSPQNWEANWHHFMTLSSRTFYGFFTWLHFASGPKVEALKALDPRHRQSKVWLSMDDLCRIAAKSELGQTERQPRRHNVTSGKSLLVMSICNWLIFVESMIVKASSYRHPTGPTESHAVSPLGYRKKICILILRRKSHIF